jgi:hypothetical protein
VAALRRAVAAVQRHTPELGQTALAVLALVGPLKYIW